MTRIVALIRRMRAGRTILMVEHNLSVVSGLSDKITVLTRGRVLAEGDYDDGLEPSRRDHRLSGDRPMLEVAGLNAWYGESHMLHGVDFEVREGEVVTLLGRNGAGKTTTLKSIMGLVPRREGSVKFRGAELINARPDMVGRAGIAFCPEERGIFASLNVTENLMLPPVVAPGGMTVDEIYTLFPNLEGAREEPGHEAVRRRAADAGDRAHPAHRREDAAAGRADRGAGAGDRAADRAHDRGDQAARLHRAAGRAEFPLRRHSRRPALRDGARPGGGHDPERPARRPHGRAARAPRHLSYRNTITNTGDKHENRHAVKFSAPPPPRPPPRTLPERCRRAPPAKSLTIGVCSDFSGPYSDIGGNTSVACVQQALEDFGAAAKGYDVDRHPGRPPEQARCRRRHRAAVVR